MSPTSDKSQIWQQLQHYSRFPDFNNYLAFILARAEGKPSEVQQAAGLLLKNNLRTAFKSMTPPYQQYIKSELLPCLGAADRHIRSTAGTIISVVVQIGGVFGWPELLHTLVKCLESNELKHMEGGMDALSKICEDIPQVLDADMPGLTERPINVFLPRLLQSPHASLRKLSLGSVNQYIMLMPEALYMSMDKYLQGLFILANDPAAEVQKLEIEGFLTHSRHEIGKVLVMLLLLCILDMVFSLLGMMQRLVPFGKSLCLRFSHSKGGVSECFTIIQYPSKQRTRVGISKNTNLGHFRYIELPIRIYHPFHVSKVEQLLSLSCLKCLKMKNRKDGWKSFCVTIYTHTSICLLKRMETDLLCQRN